MKIAYLVHQFFPEYVGGTERITLNLAQAMQRAGHNVTVIAHCPVERIGHVEKKGALFYTHCYEGVPVILFKERRSEGKSFLNLMDGSPLRPLAQDLLKKGAYDALHIMHGLYTGPFILAAICKKIPYIVTLTDYFLICYRTNLLNKADELCGGPEKGKTCLEKCRFPGISKEGLTKRYLEGQRILSQAQAVVSPSEFLKSMIEKEYGDLGIKVIPLGSVLRRANAPIKSYSRNSEIVFGYLGTISPAKGVHILIQAFRKMPRKNCKLKIYGNAYQHLQYASDLRHMAAEDPRIDFCWGYSTPQEMADIFRRIDILCFPSLWFEPYGLVLEEAFAGSVPVIASRIGGVPERVTDGVNGFMFSPGDASELQSIMEKLAKNPQRLNAVRERITTYNTVEEEAFQYECLYKQAIEGRQKVRSRWSEG